MKAVNKKKLFFKEPFPESEHIETDTRVNIKSLASPL